MERKCKKIISLSLDWKSHISCILFIYILLDLDHEWEWMEFDEQVGSETRWCSTEIRPGREHRLRLPLLPRGSGIVDLATGGAYLGSQHQVSYMVRTHRHDDLHSTRPVLHHLLGCNQPDLSGTTWNSSIYYALRTLVCCHSCSHLYMDGLLRRSSGGPYQRRIMAQIHS